jgi:hypothetical protein
MSSPDNIENNGVLAIKPSLGLVILREQILGPERFDLALELM